VELAATAPLPEDPSHSFARAWFVILGITLIGGVFIFALMRERNGQSIHQLAQQAESGDATTQSKLVEMTAGGQVVRPINEEVRRSLLKAAEAGDASTQWRLGMMYESGEGVTTDYAEAVRWYRKAAEQGYADAQYSLGVIYAYGREVPKDEAEAYFWLNLAAPTWVGSSRAEEELRSMRDEAGANLPPETRLAIQERCRKWSETHPQKPA
jgi:TPR repeat protein